MKKILDAKLGMHILEIEITTRCNLRCIHCYNRNDKNLDLPLEKFIELYNFANKNNVWRFIVSGGEAILHPKFNEIVNFIRKNKHKFELVLQTNGLLINDNILEKIKIFDLIHISYDLSEKLRKDGSKSLNLAKKLKNRGIGCYLFSTICKTNFNLIDKMVKKANQTGVPIGFNTCVPVTKFNSDFIMSKAEFVETEKKLFNLFLENKILRYSSPLIAVFDKNKEGFYQGIKGGCLAGIATCVISAKGELYPCPFFRISGGNVFDRSLKDLWLNSELLKQFRDRQKFEEPCGSCEFLSFCGGCRERAYLNSGKLTGNDPMCYKDKI